MVNSTTIDLSVVIPTYNAEGTIEGVVNGLQAAFKGGGKMQIVLVNDGSRDRTDTICTHLAQKYPDTVTYVCLAKNFGEHNAVMAGLSRAAAAYTVVMDDDFQNSPEDAIRLYEEAKKNNLDIVFSRYPKKEHSWFRNFGSWFNGVIANLIIDKPRDLYLSSFKCMSALVVREIIKYHGPYPYIDGLALRCTKNIGQVDVVHHARAVGQSGYNVHRLIALWLNMFVNFSVKPLRAAMIAGFGLVGISIAIVVAVVLEKLSGGNNIPLGWAFLTSVTVMFAGFQCMLLGVIGEYLGRLFLMENQTPQYVIRSVSGLANGIG
jgi:undecaprenyl-phosphate 4-deoxy-4-formamido-L-arabinose transferase